ncbi:hypothetical protein GWI33_007858 [Rhynchophorus ferrugineus]|uniref:Uncharacterized protein n=1 Tax=Rhynchophorus ferrugineus TaxID=354439 RepID=A0A834MEK7_RHYFE|nr:hypothetical protein GWI33_007858 [Rhynchophorus ferrugineus]
MLLRVWSKGGDFRASAVGRRHRKLPNAAPLSVNERTAERVWSFEPRYAALTWIFLIDHQSDLRNVILPPAPFTRSRVADGYWDGRSVQATNRTLPKAADAIRPTRMMRVPLRVWSGAGSYDSGIGRRIGSRARAGCEPLPLCVYKCVCGPVGSRSPGPAVTGCG